MAGLTVGDIRKLIEGLPDSAQVFGFQEAYNGADDTILFDSARVDNGNLCVNRTTAEYDEDNIDFDCLTVEQVDLLIEREICTEQDVIDYYNNEGWRDTP